MNMTNMTERQKLILDLSTKILVAEIENGNRHIWIDDLKSKRRAGIIDASVDMAQSLINKVESL